MLFVILFSFVPSTYLNVADASVYNASHSKHDAEHQKKNPQKECHSECDNEHCDECFCCAHSHTTAILPFMNHKRFLSKQEDVCSDAGFFMSAYLDGLNRPPRI